MNILINCSNLKKGGGIQVADSICSYLNKYGQHCFIVVLSSYLDGLKDKLESYENVKVLSYDIKNSFSTLVFGRDNYLDSVVKTYSIDCVLTVFGPSRWNPKCPHLSGFARSQIVLHNSPYYKRMATNELLKSKISNAIINYAFQRSSKYFYTENPYISELLEKKWPNHEIYTVTNYYHQIFDKKNLWKEHKLNDFNGCRLLCVTANYSHKNIGIAIDVARLIKTERPDIKFKFIFTVTPEQFEVPDDVKDNFELIGRVDISECPSLYEQADIMFQPTLLECFTATYVEAMRMEVPIVTTDIEFAHGLCGGAALYYEPLSAQSAANAICRVIVNPKLRNQLVSEGKEQLKAFDNSEQRVDKLLQLCQTIISKK